MRQSKELLHPLKDNDAAQDQQRKDDGQGMFAGTATQALLQRKITQRRARLASQDDPETIKEAASEGTQGAGGQLPHLNTIQQSFGSVDVSGIRAHTDEQAASASEKMGAEGFAVGNDVAFNSKGKAPDLFTSAHEAAHVVQQRSGNQPSGDVGQQGDKWEQHADQVAQAVVEGRSAESMLAQQGSNESGEKASHATQRRNQNQDQPANSESAGLLTKQQAHSAVSFNQGKRLSATVWAQVANVVKSDKSTLCDELVQGIATWQSAKGLTADGKCGDITFQWMSEEPAGVGLDNLVKKETTLFMGLNPESKGVEFSTLNKAAGGGVINASGDDKHQDQVKVGGEWASLTEGDGLDKALSLLPNLPKAKADQIINFINVAADKTRDEMFNMMQHLWAVETGKAVLKRLVISGHSGGSSIWGGHSGEFGSMSYSQLYLLFSIFPRAAGQVEDLAFSACFSGLQGNIDKYRDVFVNLKTIWGYAAWSPSAGTGSTRHITNWEKGSRGHQGAGVNQARKNVAKGTGPRDQNVAIWSIEDGYQTNVPGAQMGVQDLVAMVQQHTDDFEAAMTDGTINMAGLNELYAALQSLVRSHGAELGGDSERYNTMLLRVLYLRNWPSIMHEFATVHGSMVREGYDEAHTAVPRWEGMERTTAISTTKSFQPAGSKGQVAKKLMSGILCDLDTTKIAYGGAG